MFNNKKSQVFIVAAIIMIVAFSGLITSKNVAVSSNSYDKEEFYTKNIYLDLKDTYKYFSYVQDKDEVFNIYKTTIEYQLDHLLLNDLNNELLVIISYMDKIFLYNYFNSNVRIVSNPNQEDELEFILYKDESLIVNTFSSFEVYDEDFLVGNYTMINPLIVLNKKDN